MLGAAEHLQQQNGVAVTMVMINVGGFVTSGLQYRDKTSIGRTCPGHCLYLRGTRMYCRLVNMTIFTYMSRTLCFFKSRQSNVLSPSQHVISMLTCRHNTIVCIIVFIIQTILGLFCVHVQTFFQYQGSSMLLILLLPSMILMLLMLLLTCCHPR